MGAYEIDPEAYSQLFSTVVERLGLPLTLPPREHQLVDQFVRAVLLTCGPQEQLHWFVARGEPWYGLARGHQSRRFFGIGFLNGHLVVLVHEDEFSQMIISTTPNFKYVVGVLATKVLRPET